MFERGWCRFFKIFVLNANERKVIGLAEAKKEQEEQKLGVGEELDARRRINPGRKVDGLGRHDGLRQDES